MPGENLCSKALLISALVSSIAVALPQTVKAQGSSEVGAGLKQSSTQPALRFPPEPSTDGSYQPSIELPTQSPLRLPGSAMDVTQPNPCGMGGPAEPIVPNPTTSISPLPGESISQVPDPLSDLSTTADAAAIGVVTQCSMDAPPAPETGFPVPLPASP